MPYLTYDEYKDFGFETIEETEFDKLLPKACDVLDSVTRDFYKFNSLEDDVLFRQEQFKKAIACQIEYFFDVGSTSSHGINNPLSVQIGRTQMSSGVENQKKMNSIVASDVYMYLQYTGLLYRGIGVIG